MKKKISIVLVLAMCMVAGVAKADFTFGTPTKVPNVNRSSRDFNPSVSADGLSLFFNSNRPGGIGGIDIWVATRETTDDDWGTPVNLGPPINTPFGDWGPSISYDGLSLYFDTRQPGASGAIDDIWVATRATTDDDWGNPVNLGTTVNSPSDDCYQSISSDELALYFSSNRPGGYGNYDLWVTTRETIHDPWGTSVNLGPTVNTSAYEVDTSISADGRLLFFTSTSSSSIQTDIWVMRRATINDDWGEPVNIGSPVNSSAWEDYPNVSADGSTLFFRTSQSGRYGGGDIWQAPIIPIVDFNADGIVNTADMCIMVDYWDTDEPLCDIGPMPWGDGIVDFRDMVVLTEYWLADYRLIAHWKLDETEGTIAYDSIGSNDGTLNGDPNWQPTAGKVDGALEFNGTDNYISTDFVLNPVSGPFSVFAWIKGGEPGQVIICQTDGSQGSAWLCADSSDGKLMTNLMDAYFPPLKSESVIIDGQWHHVGLVYDLDVFHRHLYVDGTEVAKDTSIVGGLSSIAGLYIGTGKALEEGSFFSGLIDDVRIYNAALSAQDLEELER
jgi:hypothetical protein